MQANKIEPISTPKAKSSDVAGLWGRVAVVRKEVGRLGKAARNADAGFSFVSIDDYYDQVASAALEHGIWWVTRETQCVPAGFESDGGYMISYAVDLYDCPPDDEGIDFPDFWRVTIPHPEQGAQTAGAAASYAEKLFMRILFKIPSGEPDSDHFAKRSTAPPRRGPTPARPAPNKPTSAKAAPRSKDDDDDFFEAAAAPKAKPAPASGNSDVPHVLQAIEAASTPQELTRLLNAEAKFLNSLRRDSPFEHAELQRAFEQRFADLTDLSNEDQED